jgi:hypothetical protein
MIQRSGKTYVVVTSDGLDFDEVFLTWTTEMGGYYTTVDDLDEIGEYDFHDTIESAVNRAKDADSGTLGGWPYPIQVMELLNFNEAYNDGACPELVEVLTLN